MEANGKSDETTGGLLSPVNSCRNSTESIATIIFPWKTLSSRRKVTVSRSETGKEIEPSGFFLCMLSVLLLCAGLFLCASCIWAIVYKLPVSYILNNSILLDPINFNLCGGILSFPCFWIACTLHDNRRFYIYLPLLIMLLGLSLAVLSSGTTLAIIDRTNMNFVTNGQTARLLPGAYKSSLNASMMKSMSEFDRAASYKNAWDRVQRRLKCCGAQGYDDWMKHRKYIPDSCVINKKEIYVHGCLDPVAYHMAWLMCLSTGFALIVLGIQAVTILLASYLYIKEKLVSRSQLKMRHLASPFYDNVNFI